MRLALWQLSAQPLADISSQRHWHLKARRAQRSLLRNRIAAVGSTLLARGARRASRPASICALQGPCSSDRRPSQGSCERRGETVKTVALAHDASPRSLLQTLVPWRPDPKSASPTSSKPLRLSHLVPYTLAPRWSLQHVSEGGCSRCTPPCKK